MLWTSTRKASEYLVSVGKYYASEVSCETPIDNSYIRLVLLSTLWMLVSCTFRGPRGAQLHRGCSLTHGRYILCLGLSFQQRQLDLPPESGFAHLATDGFWISLPQPSTRFVT
jgi:hypothetical protein